MLEEKENPFRKGFFRNIFILNLVSIIFFFFLEFYFELKNGLWDYFNYFLLDILDILLILFIAKKYDLNLKYFFGKPNLKSVSKTIEKISINFYYALFLISFELFSLCISKYINIDNFNENFKNYTNASDDFILVSITDPNSIIKNIIVFIAVCIAAPLLEELVFRGLILHRLAIKFDIRTSMLLTSLFFGLLHGSSFIQISIFGYILSIIYLKYKKLIYPILCHFSYNLIVILYDYLIDYEYTKENDVFLLIFLSTIMGGFSLYKIIIYLKENQANNVHFTSLPYFSNYIKSNKNITFLEDKKIELKKIKLKKRFIYILGSSFFIIFSFFTIYIKYFDTEFEILEKQINTYTKGEQKNPSVSLNSNKAFITWQSEEQDGSSWGIYGKTVDYILEDKLSDDIQINETNEGKQENPCVMNLNDKFIVTWNGNGKGDKNGIFARYFNKNGIPISSEFKVNSDIAGTQSNPKILRDKIISKDNSFYIVWKNDESRSITIKKYDFKNNSFFSSSKNENEVFIPIDLDFKVLKFSLSKNNEPLLLTKKKDAVYLYSIDFKNRVLKNEKLISQKGYNPSITKGIDSNFIISWEDVNDIKKLYYLKARKYDKNLNKIKNNDDILQKSETERFKKPLSFVIGGHYTSLWEGSDVPREKSFFKSVFNFIIQLSGFIKDLGININKNNNNIDTFQVNSYGKGNQINFSIDYNITETEDDNYSYLFVVWQSEKQDGDKNGIFARALDDF